MNNLIAAVLAGGKGKRLEHLTSEQPKPMVPYAGSCRMIDFSMDNCVNSSIREVVLMSKHLELSLIEYLYRQWSDQIAINFGLFDPGSQCADEMTRIAMNRPEEFGTADALLSNRPYIDQPWVEDVLVLHCDHIYNFDYTEMQRQHRATGAALTLGYQRIPMEYVKLFGMVKFDDQGQLTEFVEKHPNPSSDCVFTAVGIFNKDVMYEALDELRVTEWKHDISFDLIPWLMRRGEKILGYQFDDYWEDIGTVERYYKAHMKLLDDRSYLNPPITLPGAAQYIHSESESFEQVLMPEAMSNKNFFARKSVIFPEANVGENARLDSSIIMPGGIVKPGEALSNCLVSAKGRSQL